MPKKILILGGDLRQYYMAKFLSKNFAIYYFGHLLGDMTEKITRIDSLEKLEYKLYKEHFECVILPIPLGEAYVKGTNQQLSCEKMVELLKLQKSTVVFGCGENPHVKKLIENGVEYIDLLKEETVVYSNARLTAENAVVEAMIESDKSVMGSKSLIIGYGRCGRMLADVLRGMHGEVSVAETMKEKQGLAISFGYRVCRLCNLAGYDFVFQTAPEAGIITEELLFHCLSEENPPMIFNLSSVVESVDEAFAKKNHIFVKHCPGLPGKYTAKSAGELLGKQIEKKLKNEGVH